MDFLQRVVAEIRMTSRPLDIDHHTFHFVDQGRTPTGPCLASGGGEWPALLTHSEMTDESVGDWVRTVELAATVSVPPLSATITRSRFV